MFLQNEPRELFKQGIISQQEYDIMEERNQFAIAQLKHLKKTIQDFIQDANYLATEWNMKLPDVK